MRSVVLGADVAGMLATKAPSPRRPLEVILRLIRWMAISYAAIAMTVAGGGLAVHAYAARGDDNFEQVISWSTKYVLTPGILAEDGHLAPNAILPLARIIEKIFIGGAGFGPQGDAHTYWRGRMLQPMASTYGKLQMPDQQIDRGRAAVAVFAGLASRHPAHIEYRRRLARSHQLLGEDLAAQGQHGPALTQFEAALSTSETLLRDQPGHWRWRWYEAMAYLGAAASSTAVDRPDAARHALVRGYPVAAGLRSDEPSDSRWLELVAKFDAALGPLRGPGWLLAPVPMPARR